MRRKKLLAYVVLVALVASSGVSWAKKWDPKKEREIGKRVCAEVDKQYKRWKNEAALKRVQAIVAAIVPHTDRPDVKYDVRLVDDKEVNAFSIPGGFIYVTRGLLEAVQSDDELAGVLAHEIAHNCTYDALNQAERSSKLFMGALGVALAAVLLGAKSQVVATTAQAGLFVRQGILSKYSLEIEARADRNAVRYLSNTKYNPVGLLTFMERLARKERREQPPEAGIYETHPLSRQRVVMLMDEITAAGFTINRRAVTKWRKPEIKETKVGDTKWPSVTWWDEVLFTVVGPDADKAKKRAQDITRRLTDVLAKGARRADFSLQGTYKGPALVGLGQNLLVITEQDAKAQGKTQDELAQQAYTALRRALTRERFAYQF